MLNNRKITIKLVRPCCRSALGAVRQWPSAPEVSSQVGRELAVTIGLELRLISEQFACHRQHLAQRERTSNLSTQSASLISSILHALGRSILTWLRQLAYNTNHNRHPSL